MSSVIRRFSSFERHLKALLKKYPAALRAILDEL